MDFELYKFLAPLIAGFNFLSISISLGYLKKNISRVVLRFQLCTLLLLIIDYLEFYLSYENQMVFVIKIGHLILQLLTFSWFVFSLHYTGYERIVSKKFILVIAVLITFNTVIIFTNDFHHLFYQSISFLNKGGHSTLKAEYGFYFWIICAFDYIFIIAGVVFIAVSYIRGGSFYRSQAQFILIGFIFPLVVNIIYIFRLIPGFSKDFSAISFAITGLFTFIGTYRFRILNYAPLSRSLVLQNIHDALITLDLDYRLIDFNIMANKIFDLTEKDLGQKIERGFLGSVVGNISTFFYKKDYVSFIKEINGKSFNLNIRRLHDEKNREKGIILTFNDVTEKIKLLEELESRSKKIDQMQSHLIQSEKMAALGQLSAEVSHEINNPLTFIKSNFSVLNKYLNEGTFYDNIDDIKDLVVDTNQGIERISEVVKNMLNYSRDDGGSGDTLYDINRGVESTLVLARSVIRHRAKLKLVLGSNIPKLKISGRKVDQVILNLLVNSAHAIDETRTDGIITVRTYVKDKKVFCDISDNGTPIKSEDKELIFEPYYTTKSANNGTGLGLPLSRRILESHCHGRLYLTDSIDKVFRIEIPLSDE